MKFFDGGEGTVYCEPCRDKMLVEYGPGGTRHPGPDEITRAEDFKPLGAEPWSSELEADDQYVQCDGCLGQWGPAA